MPSGSPNESSINAIELHRISAIAKPNANINIRAGNNLEFHSSGFQATSVRHDIVARPFHLPFQKSFPKHNLLHSKLTKIPSLLE
jgi:hypothetical protein